MEKVYTSDMKESMIKSYVVKINEKIINLANLDEAVALLQAAVNKYDENHEYQVELQLDPTRELPVMSAGAGRGSRSCSTGSWIPGRYDSIV